jgi:hypothetical protein
MKCPYCGNEIDASQPGNPGDGSTIKCGFCGNWIPLGQSVIRGSPKSPEPVQYPPSVEPISDQYRIQRKSMTFEDVKKYFLHGLVFSIVMFGIVIGWAVVLVFLVVVGSVIGLIIGVLALAYVIGWLNVNLSSYFWHIRSDSKWTALLAHGFLLLIALIVVGIPQLLFTTVVPGILTSILLFIVYCFVDGFVAKNVAEKIF